MSAIQYFTTFIALNCIPRASPPPPLPHRKLECLKMGLFTLLNALPKGAFKEGGLTTDEVEGLSEQQQREGLPAATTTSGWTPSLRECWVSHVASATRSQVCGSVNHSPASTSCRAKPVLRLPSVRMCGGVLVPSVGVSI